MEGLKAAIEFITELKEGSMEPKVLEINGNTYCNKNLTRYHYFPKADSLSVNTLTSIVDYIKGKTGRTPGEHDSACNQSDRSKIVFRTGGRTQQGGAYEGRCHCK